jgi:hypothetical protein
MNDALIQVMNRIPSHALSVFLFLQHRSELDTKIGLTQQEISRATGYSVGKVRESLGWLEYPDISDSLLVKQPQLSPFVKVAKYSNAYKVTLLEPYTSPERWVRFTFEDTDDRRIATLEKELRRLSTKTKQTSRLSLALQGAPQQLIAEIEGDLGRPLSIEEAFLLGRMVEGFGPERIRQAWRRHAADLDNPIRGLYAMFMNKRFGAKNPREEKEVEVAYQKVTRDVELL